jgi:hypothetical protein
MVKKKPSEPVKPKKEPLIKSLKKAEEMANKT